MATLTPQAYGFEVRVRVGGKPRKIGLGRIAKGRAEAIRGHIAALESVAKHGGQLNGEAVAWLATIDDTLHGRLAFLGLTTARAAVVRTVGELIEHYKERRFEQLKPGTRAVMEQAFRAMREHLGADTPLAAVTPGDAEDFASKEAAKTPKRIVDGRKYARATVQKRCEIATRLFGHAIKHRMLDRNPFVDAGVSRSPVASEKRFFLPASDARRILAELPGVEWQLLFSLARWAGVRVPSEPRLLRFSDVDWANNRFRIRSPKTERQGKAERWVPIFPELRAPLLAACEAAGEGDALLMPSVQYLTGAAIRRPLEVAILAAGLDVWPNLWKSLRSTRETELLENYPAHAACGWIGNSVAVAVKHYAQIPRHYFEAAANGSPIHGTNHGTVSDCDATLDGEASKREAVKAREEQ